MDFCQSEPVFNKVPLYQPDQLTFNHTSVAPTTIATTSTESNNSNHSDLNNSNAKNNPLVSLNDSASTSPSWTPPSYELQEMLIHYQSQPDLLQLILESKLQEDKRRTEEARLRAKELDLMLLQHQQLHRNSFTTSSLLSEITTTASSSSSLQNNHHQQHHDFRKRRHSSLNNINENSSEELDEVMFLQQLTSSFPDSSSNNNNNDTQGSLASSAYPLNELYHPHDPLTTNTSSPSSTTTTTITTNITIPTTPSSSSTISTSSPLSPSSPSTPNSSFLSSSSNNNQKPRKRREMQAITKLVETREFPYLDGYFWRNNGNTIQKKTGNKSVYYKCSNSSKNCTVNKTILFKENGEYLIKYRGEHLPECGKVQHIVDV